MKVERTYAVNATRKFLQDLMLLSVTPGVPKAVRNRAGRLLRHYPSEHIMEMACNGHHVFASDVNEEFTTNEEWKAKKAKAAIKDL